MERSLGPGKQPVKARHRRNLFYSVKGLLHFNRCKHLGYGIGLLRYSGAQSP